MNKQIAYQIKSLDNMIMRSVINVENISKEELKKVSPTQLQIISYLVKHENEEVYQKDLEDILNVRRATVSGVLQTMEKNNLITRKISKIDTRVKVITLNPKTKAVFDEKKKKFHELDNEIIKGISDEELNIFENVINKMKENLMASYNVKPIENK